MSSILPVSAAAPSMPSGAASSSASGNSGSVVDSTMIANNFTTFLTLLTTQLKNQNPLDPLDTNQFTQQLVQFAQVEQQMKSNSQLQTLIGLQQTAQASMALNYVGATVVVDGSTGMLSSGQATWNLNVTKPAAGTLTIQDATGKTVYTSPITLNPGGQPFVWNGLSTDGQQLPDGPYTLSVVANDASKQNVPVSIEMQGTVDSVDLTQNPPLLTIANQTYTMDKIKRVVRARSASQVPFAARLGF
jgi:flagellar basal-body rod modification protein FlgD